MANSTQMASLPAQRQPSRFVELMTALFQFDEAEAVDFGLYRIIRRHNREMRTFLGEIVTDGACKALKGGRLAELLDASFETLGDEVQADDKFRIKGLEEQLGLKPNDKAHYALDAVLPSPASGRGEDGSVPWVAAKLAEHPADRVHTNDPAGLSFEGCDRLEAIEAVFALQFGRS